VTLRIDTVKLGSTIAVIPVAAYLSNAASYRANIR
jgi:hypothetical protein